jgi:PAS domain S-box-containing protein
MKHLFSETVEITSLDEAKRLVKESTNGFLKLFDYSPACMSLTTLGKRTYVKVNEKFIEKLGFTEEEIIGFTSAEIGILDKEESDKVATLFKEKGRLQNDIVICKAKGGKEVYTVSSIEKIEFNGEFYLLSSFLDITKIIEQQHVIEKQKQVIEEQKTLVDEAYAQLQEKNKEVMDSIYYAKRIQAALITSEKYIENAFNRLMKRN